MFLSKPIELARPNPSHYKKKQNKNLTSAATLPTSPNRITEISETLHLEPTPIVSNLSDETIAAEEEQQEESQSNETLLPPSIEEMTFNDDDKTLNDLLSSLHSTRVRRMHKYTDEQLRFMHKHNEFNRMLQSYVDVSIHNGKV
jgi:NH3-dependent NAD+ synthetase